MHAMRKPLDNKFFVKIYQEREMYKKEAMKWTNKAKRLERKVAKLEKERDKLLKERGRDAV